ncbi:hypothetical protein OU994_26090 [Pseudoduganella sp. SL102]|uniref:hypothetical protein n=1 Tax=Pseudoduganella sp. SL102 TaxID=2995154 RepID=UPI00248C3B1C|nr:hypothetical protein [Pseudoduganella sp. SL102]WBS01699.1 hypothetical protein OU994_26090 [Pseudoduganella sp. SL102]
MPAPESDSIRNYVPAAAFFCWSFAAPLFTWWVFFKLSHMSANAGYLLPFIAIIGVAVILFAALLIGWLTRTLAPSLLGAVSGLIVIVVIGLGAIF